LEPSFLLHLRLPVPAAVLHLPMLLPVICQVQFLNFDPAFLSDSVVLLVLYQVPLAVLLPVEFLVLVPFKVFSIRLLLMMSKCKISAKKSFGSKSLTRAS
jgi:hypothetical protein